MSAPRGYRAPPLALEALAVMIHLRRCGVAVHRAAPMPIPANGDGSVVVFLDPTLDQGALARRCVQRMLQVNRVTFSGHCPVVMYVHVQAGFPLRQP